MALTSERMASYNGDWSSLQQKPKPVKTKTGLTTLDGNLVTTLTKAEFDRFRAENAARIHVVIHQPSSHGGEAA